MSARAKGVQRGRKAMIGGLLGFLIGLGGCAGWPSSSPVCAAGTQMDLRGRCVSNGSPEHHLPFRDGEVIQVTQGFHGFVSHRDDLAFAVDFGCEEGTPITASRSGVVWAARGDSNRGCGSPECVADANYVILDHGDGTYSSYYHLQHKGALVEPGDQVCQGQLIGLCGATGYATGPHLHFSVMNIQWLTMPVAFREARFRPGGVVLPREHYRSENRRVGYCRKTKYSTIDRGAFAHRGIILRRELPTVVEASNQGWEVEGVYTGEMTHVAVHRRPMGSSEWREECVALDRRGRFQIELKWERESFPEGEYFLMITGSDENCSAPGWSRSYRVRVDH